MLLGPAAAGSSVSADRPLPTGVYLVGGGGETRGWITRADTDEHDERALDAAGVQDVIPIGGGVLQLPLGLNADRYASEM
ncbi:hypothetical protein [Thiocapsa roseopersicina]|uniref:Uncharacterized protein n=1 Tax=Thiocapsa roseopersicina TaxID=1058 RepID=A0A1H3CD37_THIRO|nr:hypothetical protein [Thiocapsa roseopersicina]SDX51950.1 hypothetical protein SAMN05421783_1333 [Thiocapsa roseopersicina]